MIYLGIIVLIIIALYIILKSIKIKNNNKQQAIDNYISDMLKKEQSKHTIKVNKQVENKINETNTYNL
jgi:hypothetical protein